MGRRAHGKLNSTLPGAPYLRGGTAREKPDNPTEI
jgi:hypothetical protein